MSSQIADRSISRQRLMQMFNRRKPVSSESNTSVSEAPLLDWNCPHHFDPEGWIKVKDMGNRMAASIEKGLAPMCLEAPKVTLKKVLQDYAHIAAGRMTNTEKPPYFMPLVSQAKKTDGFLGVPMEAAGVLIAQVLRDPEVSVGQGGSFSSLEETLLQDALAGLTDVVLSALQGSGQKILSRSDRIVRGQWPLEARQMQDLCGFAFTVAFAKQSIEIQMMAVAEIVDSLLGIAVRAQKSLSAAEQTKKMIRLVQDVPVKIKAELSRFSIRVEDLVTMEPGDVLVTDTPVSDPVNVLLDGKISFRAWPALCQGQFALVMAPAKKTN